jgi:hypothetical protein
MNTIEFRLRDYLLPGGKFKREVLPQHLEDALQAGNRVWLISVPGHFMLSGTPGTHPNWRPWSDGNYWYKTAKDGLDMKNGVSIEEDL